jgi:hypothetical protein
MNKMATATRAQCGTWVALAICLAAIAAQAAPTYRITIIPTGNVSLPGPYINDQGVIAGSAHVTGDPWSHTARAFRWAPDTGLVFSAAIDRNSSTLVRNIDANGRIASQWEKPDWPERILLWDGSSDSATRLDKGRIWAGNSQGDLMGNTVSPFGAPRVIWTYDGRKIHLPPRSDIVNAINNQRQMVGYEWRVDDTRLFRWATFWQLNGKQYRIRPPAGYREDYSQALDINDAGELVGWALEVNGSYGTAFFWSQATGALPVGMQTGGLSPGVYAISSTGTVIGTDGRGTWAWSKDEGDHLLSDSIDPTDPNYAAVRRGDLGLYEAKDVNASGQIVVWGFSRDEGYVTILLTPAAP